MFWCCDFGGERTTTYPALLPRVPVYQVRGPDGRVQHIAQPVFYHYVPPPPGHFPGKQYPVAVSKQPPRPVYYKMPPPPGAITQNPRPNVVLNSSPAPETPKENLEKDYFEGLKKAKDEDALGQEIDNLLKISNLYRDKKQFTIAAKTLNCIIARTKNHPFRDDEKTILPMLEDIEKRFLESKGIKPLVAQNGCLATYRSRLKHWHLLE